jgi:hypothetical protein
MELFYDVTSRMLVVSERIIELEILKVWWNYMTNIRFLLPPPVSLLVLLLSFCCCCWLKL